MRSKFSLFRLLVVSATILLLSAGPAIAGQDKEATILELGKPVERELSSGQTQSFTLTLAAGDFLQVSAEQRGINLALSISTPDGKPFLEVDNANQPTGAEEILFVAETAGLYQLKVRAIGQNQTAGRYEIKVKEQKPATAETSKAFAAWLSKQVEILGNKRQIDAALPLAQRVVAVQEKTLGPDHPDLAGALNNLGVLYLVKGDVNRAAGPLRRALALREKSPNADPELILDNVIGLLRIAVAQRDLAAAEQLLEKEKALTGKRSGSKDLSLALALNGLGQVYLAQGNYVRAEPLLERALGLVEKQRGVNSLEAAGVLNNLGTVYFYKGDYRRAETNYQQALDIREKSLRPDDPQIAQSLNFLAGLYNSKNDYARALPLYLKAYGIREKIAAAAQTPEAELNLAAALNGLGVVYQGMGELEQAEPLYRRALGIYANYNRSESPEAATATNNLAILTLLKGQYDQAEPLYRRALEIREKTLGPQHPLVAKTLDSFAVNYDLKGDTAEAIKLRNRELEIRENDLGVILATGSEEQKRAYITQPVLSDEVNITLTLNARSAPKDPAAARMAMNLILQRKGRVLDALTDSIGTLRRRLDPEGQKLLDQLAAINSRLSSLSLIEQGGAGYLAEIARLKTEKQKLEAAISAKSAGFGLQSQSVTLERVQKLIPADTALVEIASYRPFDRKEKRIKARFGAPYYSAYVLKSEGPPSFVELGEAATIDREIEELRRALRNRRRADVKRVARRVDRLVMEPIRALLGETRKVLISPDGSLNLIPFAALVDERNRYLVTRYSFTYLSSGRDLLRLAEHSPSRQPALIVANPAFGDYFLGGSSSNRGIGLKSDAKQSSGSTGATTGAGAGVTVGPATTPQAVSLAQAYFRPLPGTAGEARALKALLPEARLLTAEQATKSAVKQAAGPKILHVASHGFFLDSLAGAGGLRGRGLGLPASAKPAPAPAKEAEASSIDPLLRSGLALAGANERKSGDDNGILTALEVTGLDLQGTQLVVLSACDTGVGEIRAGDGVYGLRRALVLAGSESQLISLWPVSDLGTRDLMIAYYQRLNRGLGRNEALRKVQLQMLKSEKRRHPFYWASFIQSGEWANLKEER